MLVIKHYAIDRTDPLFGLQYPWQLNEKQVIYVATTEKK